MRLARRLLPPSFNVATDDPSLIALARSAQQQFKKGDLAAAWRGVERGWPLVAQAPRTPEGRAAVHVLAAVRAQMQFAAGDLGGVRRTSTVSRELAGRHPHLDFIDACAWEARARGEPDALARDRLREAALEIFRHAVASHGEPVVDAHVTWDTRELVDGATGWAAWTRIGLIHLQRADPDHASDAFDHALATRPDHAEALLGKIECDLLRGDAQRVLGGVDAHRNRGPDVWLLAAAAAEELGAIEPMANFLAKAAELLKLGYVSAHRSVRHAELVCAMAAYRGAPMAGPGQPGAIGALLGRSPMRRGDCAVGASDLRVARCMIRNLLSCGRGHFLPALLEPRAETVLPGIGAQVLAIFAELGIVVGDDHEPEPVFLVGQQPSAVAFVAGMLSAHPRLACYASEVGLEPLTRKPIVTRDELLAAIEHVHVDSERGRGKDRRAVYVAPNLGTMSSAVTAALPGARVINVEATVGSSGMRSPSGPRHFDIGFDELLDSPVESSERLLAFIGEAAAVEVVRHVIEHYPSRRARSACR